MDIDFVKKSFYDGFSLNRKRGIKVKKDFKVFVADIDGTLAAKGEMLMPHTKAALEKLHEQGVLIGVATGRPLDSRVLAKPGEWELSFDFDFAIGMNGGDLWEKGNDEIEHFYLLERTVVKEILEMLSEFDINAIVYEKGYDQIACLRMDPFMVESQARNRSIVEVGDIERLSRYDTGKIEVHCSGKEKERILAKIAKHQSGKWAVMQTFAIEDTFTIEFLDPRINKGMGLEKFAQRNQIPLEEIIAFGDMENDIPLLEKAGWGVCLANGSSQTKEKADAVTDYTVDEDGLGRYLEEHIL